MSDLPAIFAVKMFLNRTEYCQDRQAEAHEQQQDEGSEEQAPREPATGATLSVLQVLVHTVHQAVGPGAVTQLSAGLVDLEGVTHSYAPHLHGRRISATQRLQRANTALRPDTTSDWWLPQKYFQQLRQTCLDLFEAECNRGHFLQASLILIFLPNPRQGCFI